jgi:hypothetical protein
MDGAMADLKEKLDRLIREAAEISVALDQADGTISGIPHYSNIEARAHERGRQLSREVQARHMQQLAKQRISHAACPKCGTRCELASSTREVNSIDGRVELEELEGYCPICRRAFFPR